LNDDLRGTLLTAEEYFDKDTLAKAIYVDGHFRGNVNQKHPKQQHTNRANLGWVNPVLVEKYQLDKNAAEAWENNGGGTFSFKDPLGTGKNRVAR
jgi:hypothetical protein